MTAGAKNIYFFILLVSEAFFSFLAPLEAQTLRGEFGFERGKMPVMQGNRIQNDTMISEVYPAGTHAYMMPFSEKEDDAPYLRLRGSWEFSRMEAFLGLYADKRITSHQAVRISSYRPGAIIFSDDQVLNNNISYRERKEKEVEAGLKFTVLEDRLYFSFKMGKRFFDDSYILSMAGMQNQNILGISTNYFIFRKPDKEDNDNKTSLKTQGNYLGIQIDYSPVDKLMLSLSHAAGKLNGNQVQQSMYSKLVYGNPTYIYLMLDQYRSAAQISFSRSGFSLEYRILKNFRMIVGLESETRTIAFPAYSMLYSSNPVFVFYSPGSMFYSSYALSDPEALSDYAIYSKKEKIKEQKIYLGMAVEYDFSKKDGR